ALVSRAALPPPPGAATSLAERPRPEGERPAPEPKAGDAPDAPADAGRGPLMTVAGRVDGPGGAPVPRARVLVLTARYRHAGEPGLTSEYQLKVLGSGTADAQGRFRLAVPQTTPRDNYRVTVLASAPTYAPTYQI